MDKIQKKCCFGARLVGFIYLAQRQKDNNFIGPHLSMWFIVMMVAVMVTGVGNEEGVDHHENKMVMVMSVSVDTGFGGGEDDDI